MQKYLKNYQQIKILFYLDSTDIDILNKNQLIQQISTTSKMSQYNKNGNLDNYLAKNSLFKGSQKSKLVSPYVSHLNYFDREDDNQRLQRSLANNFGNTFKKEYVIPSKNTQSPYESKNDILKPTSKKQLLQPRQDVQKKIVKSSFVSHGNQYNNGNKNAQFLQNKQMNSQNQSQRYSNQAIKPLKNNSSIINPRQSKMQIDQYNNQQVFNAFNEDNDEWNNERILSKRNSELIKLSQRQLASRNQYKADQMAIVNQQQTINSESIKKDSYNKLTNPYYQNYQFQTRKELTGLKNTDSIHFDTTSLNLKNTKDQGIQAIESPQQTIYNSKNISSRKNQDAKINENNNYILNNIRNNTGQYLTNVNQRLKKCYKCLESLQSEVDILLDKNLEQQCNNLKQSLFRMIQIEIEQFRERERHQLRKSKFYFMADLYEIKCNIDLRLQQIEDYSHLLAHQYKWKNVIGNIMTPNYEESIKCIEQKTDQIYRGSDAKTNHQLTIFKKSFHQNITIDLQKQIKKIFNNIFDRFIQLQNDKKRNQIGSMYYETMNRQNESIYTH